MAPPSESKTKILAGLRCQPPPQLQPACAFLPHLSIGRGHLRQHAHNRSHQVEEPVEDSGGFGFVLRFGARRLEPRCEQVRRSRKGNGKACLLVAALLLAWQLSSVPRPNGDLSFTTRPTSPLHGAVLKRTTAVLLLLYGNSQPRLAGLDSLIGPNSRARGIVLGRLSKESPVHHHCCRSSTRSMP